MALFVLQKLYAIHCFSQSIRLPFLRCVVQQPVVVTTPGKPSGGALASVSSLKKAKGVVSGAYILRRVGIPPKCAEVILLKRHLEHDNQRSNSKVREIGFCAQILRLSGRL